MAVKETEELSVLLIVLLRVPVTVPEIVCVPLIVIGGLLLAVLERVPLIVAETLPLPDAV